MLVTADFVRLPADKVKEMGPVSDEMQRRMYRNAERAALRGRLFMLGAGLGIASLAWYAGGKSLLATEIAKRQAEVRQREEASGPKLSTDMQAIDGSTGQASVDGDCRAAGHNCQAAGCGC